MAAASFYKKLAIPLAIRDGGLSCHYCDARLVPPGVELDDPRFYDDPIVYSVNFGSHVYTRIYHFFKPIYREGTVDHVVPQIKGGTHDLGNLVLACKQCNSSKKNRDYSAFTGTPE